MGRQYLELTLKNLTSTSGVKLIEMFFKNHTDIDIHYVRLGQLAVYYNSENTSIQQITILLKEELGFEIIENKELQIIEKIKIAAIELIHYSNNTNSLIRNSDYISQKLQLPYEKLSKIFSIHTKKTLENYILGLKIEKIKFLILSNDYSISEIAYMMEYSSVQYMSNQFKKNTGLTLSEFKANPFPHLIPIEEI